MASKPSKKAPAPRHKYRLKFHPQALTEWRVLDNSVSQPLKKALAKRLDNPHVPSGRLRGPLTTCYKIKLKKVGVRLVYEVDDESLFLYVWAVDRRESSAAYESAEARLKASAAIAAAARRSK